MERDREAVGLVADLLNRVQDGIEAVEADGLALVSPHVHQFLALGDRRQGLRRQAQLLQRLGRRVQLAHAAID